MSTVCREPSRLNPNFAIGGWIGYANQLHRQRDADVWNWAVTLAFPNLGKEGNLGGILIGMEPKVTDDSTECRWADETYPAS